MAEAILKLNIYYFKMVTAVGNKRNIRRVYLERLLPIVQKDGRHLIRQKKKQYIGKAKKWVPTQNLSSSTLDLPLPLVCILIHRV